MATPELRPEIEEAVPRVHLAAAKGMAVGGAVVDTGLAGEGDPEAGVGDEPLLALAEEPGRIGECLNLPAKSLLELP